MRKLFRELFYIPKYAKVREKVMLARATITVVIIVTCLAAMSITAYAYFSYNITSGSNIIKAADFDLSISVTDISGETAEQLTAATGNTYTLPAGRYSICLEKSGTAKTGFCVIETILHQTKTTYHTQQIGTDLHSGTDEITKISFTLDLTGITDNATVTFTPHWGTSCFYGYPDNHGNLYIEDTKTVCLTGININNPVNETETETETTPSETTPPTEAAEVVYTVAEGDYLMQIAEQYNTTVSRIAAYNEIEDPRILQIGQQLKIPPTDWQIPADNTAQATAAPEQTEPTASTDAQPATENTEAADAQPATENTEATDASQSS